jgi:hypothetical protein
MMAAAAACSEGYVEVGACEPNGVVIPTFLDPVRCGEKALVVAGVMSD